MEAKNLYEAIAVCDLCLNDPVVIENGMARRAMLEDLRINEIYHVAEHLVVKGDVVKLSGKDTTWNIEYELH